MDVRSGLECQLAGCTDDGSDCVGNDGCERLGRRSGAQSATILTAWPMQLAPLPKPTMKPCNLQAHVPEKALARLGSGSRACEGKHRHGAEATEGIFERASRRSVCSSARTSQSVAPLGLAACLPIWGEAPLGNGELRASWRTGACLEIRASRAESNTFFDFDFDF